jgi:hypothetical protein
MYNELNNVTIKNHYANIWWKNHGLRNRFLKRKYPRIYFSPWNSINVRAYVLGELNSFTAYYAKVHNLRQKNNKKLHITITLTRHGYMVMNEVIRVIITQENAAETKKNRHHGLSFSRYVNILIISMDSSIGFNANIYRYLRFNSIFVV